MQQIVDITTNSDIFLYLKILMGLLGFCILIGGSLLLQNFLSVRAMIQDIRNLKESSRDDREFFERVTQNMTELTYAIKELNSEVKVFRELNKRDHTLLEQKIAEIKQ